MIETKRILEEYSVKPPFIHKGFHAHFYPIDFVQLIWNKWGDYSGFYYKLHISALHNEYWDLYYFPEEFTALRKHYFEKLAKNKNYLKKHYRDWKNYCKKLDKKIMKLEKAIQKNSFEKILHSYKIFVKEYLFEYALAAPIQEACGFQPEQWINPEIQQYCEENSLKYNQTLSILTSPIVNSFITQEEIDLLKISIAIKEGRQVDKLVEKHVMKWFWVKNNYADIKELDSLFFKERISELKKHSIKELQAKIKELEAAPEKTTRRKNKLFEKFPLPKKLKLFVKLTEVFSEMQDVRKSYVLKANHYHKMFLQTVCKKFLQPLESLFYYSYYELINSIKTESFLSNEELKKRKEFIVSVESKKEKIILSGEEAKYFYNHLQENIESVESFKGTIANLGKAVGIVKIVLKSQDIEKVCEGDILVSSMTRPEMTPAMKKAAAFVTDEGGITSHAAIVARELKKPCIIGTKIATKILKDGDKVEVDAVKGIVKKLQEPLF